MNRQTETSKTLYSSGVRLHCAMTKAEANQKGDQDLEVAVRALERVLSLSNQSLSGVEKALGFANSTLHRWFSGKSEIRLRQLLVLLAYLKIEPSAFFEFAYRTAELDGQSMLEALIRSPLGRAEPADDKDLPNYDEEEIRKIVLEVMRQHTAGKKT
jgi:transcriptional regulator with XRE-family HTH domain